MNDENLTKIELRVEDGEGGAYVETSWAKPVGDGLFQLENSPFYAYGVSWLDVVEARKPEDNGFPVFTKVVEKSGNRTVRVIFNPPIEDGNVSKKIVDTLVELGCSFEGANPSYIAINIPREVDFWKIRDFLVEKELEWEYADPSYSTLFPDD